MSAATATTRRLVLALAALLYAGVFAAFVFVESPGLGIGNFFYIPICLVALVTDEARGALAGVLAAGSTSRPSCSRRAVPSAQALTTATGIRLVTFTLVGALIGFYASRNRQLVDRLRDLAGRDFVTGLGNARAFDEELAKRCAAGTAVRARARRRRRPERAQPHARPRRRQRRAQAHRRGADASTPSPAT